MNVRTKSFEKFRGGYQSSSRSSNLELFRIITMLLIVAHHYVVNSGLTLVDGPMYANPTSWKALFLFVFGAWGKIGINCFVLITGYFMCTSHITVKKYLKLLIEIIFYKLVIYFIFLLSGYEPFSVKGFISAVLPITDVAQGFTSCFLLFYLCIPFLNILIEHLNEKQHLYLLLLLSFIYIFFGTFRVMGMGVDMNYVSWFMVIYLMAAYIRKYPKEIFEKERFWKWMMIGTVSLAVLSVVVCVWIGSHLNLRLAYFFVTDSNTFLAVVTALSAFMYFKNLKIKNSKFINTVAASTFGVLLIHANSDTMRRWLWQDVLHNVEVYDTAYLVPHAVLSVLAIYVICTIIDYLRIRFIEKPFLVFWDKHESVLVSKYKTIESAICRKLQIGED